MVGVVGIMETGNHYNSDGGGGTGFQRLIVAISGHTAAPLPRANRHSRRLLLAKHLHRGAISQCTLNNDLLPTVLSCLQNVGNWSPVQAV